MPWFRACGGAGVWAGLPKGQTTRIGGARLTQSETQSIRGQGFLEVMELSSARLDTLPAGNEHATWVRLFWDWYSFFLVLKGRQEEHYHVVCVSFLFLGGWVPKKRHPHRFEVSRNGKHRLTTYICNSPSCWADACKPFDTKI